MMTISKIYIAPLFIDALSLLMLVSLVLGITAIAIGQLKNIKDIVSNYVNRLSLGREHRLARANYKPRILGFAATFVVITFLTFERGWSSWYFFFLVLSFLIYPHLVLLASKAANGKKRVEITAMMFDTFMLGLWTAHIHFFLWMSYAFLASVMINSIMVGGFRQLWKTLALFTAGVLIGGVMTGFELELEAPFHIELIAMISLLFYAASIAATFYDQTRRLAEIRIELEKKNETLSETIQELEEAKEELVEEAHKAGMAELATGVLHNVGNILNSVNTSSSIIERTAHQSAVKKLEQANGLLREHIDGIEAFIAEDPKGKQLLRYYLELEEPLKNEQSKIIHQSKRLTHKINLINEVIAAQQSYAGTNMDADQISLSEIIEDALTLQAGSISQLGLTIEKDLQQVDPIIAQRSKLIHVLVNLLQNAKDAVHDNLRGNKIVTIKNWQDEDHVYLSVTDNGTGIKQEHLKKIFTHGFTTKQNGHGFGLHSSANYMKEMEGEVSVNSKGPGAGTTFTLTFSKIILNEGDILQHKETKIENTG